MSAAADPLERIIAEGNRGHNGSRANWLLCADGYSLSVIAGGGTYCSPRPASCTCAFSLRPPHSGPFPGEVEHDYPGPYTHVEVGYLSGKPKPYAPWKALGGKWKRADVFSSVPVDLVRGLVAAHGGVVGSFDDQHLTGWCLWVGSGHSCDCDRGPADDQ